MKIVKEILKSVFEVDRGEDRWSDKMIDQHLRKKAGVKNAESPGAILDDPEWVDLPQNIEEVRRSLSNILGYTKGREMTSDEFKNFCIWVTKLPLDIREMEQIAGELISYHGYIYKDIKEGLIKYGEGVNILQDKFRREDDLENENS